MRADEEREERKKGKTRLGKKGERKKKGKLPRRDEKKERRKKGK